MKADLIARLGRVEEDLRGLIRNHPVAHVRNKWGHQTFIYKPESSELSTFELGYGDNAKRADSCELATIQSERKKFADLVSQGQETEEIFEALLATLNGGLDELNQLFPGKHPLLSEQTSAHSRYADLSLFIHDLWRAEYALRLNVSSLIGAAEAIGACLSLELNSEVKEERIEKIATIVTQLEQTRDTLMHALETYAAVKDPIRIYISAAIPAVLEADKKCFMTALTALQVKLDELQVKGSKDKSYLKAGLQAGLLYTELEAASNDFFLKKGSFVKFKERCKKAIEASEPELGNHRGWAEVFANIAFALTTLLSLGTALLASKALTGNWRFFTPQQPDAAVKLEVFKAEVAPILGY